jgi:hypothetical protein
MVGFAGLRVLDYWLDGQTAEEERNHRIVFELALPASLASAYQVKPLSGWQLRDRQNQPRPLEGELKAGNIPRDRFSMQLGNNGGTIQLYRGKERVAKVTYGRAAQDKVIQFKQINSP